MNDPHVCGARGVYHADCRRCLVLELAAMPRSQAIEVFRRIAAEHGRESMLQLVEEVKACRSSNP